MATVKTSVIIPVWNRGDLTMQFLDRHWQLYSRRQDLEIVVVDNGSTDLTSTVLEHWGKVLGNRITVLCNDDNRGFGAGNNQGVHVAKGDTLIFISNDVIASGNYVAEIEQHLRPNALLGAELLARDTGWNTFVSPQGEITIPYLAGWCVACDRRTWTLLAGWDERYYPSDYEDIDLSYDATRKGVQLVSLSLPLRHLFGQSAARIAGGREAATMRNRRQFMEKWGLSE